MERNVAIAARCQVFAMMELDCSKAFCWRQRVVRQVDVATLMFAMKVRMIALRVRWNLSVAKVGHRTTIASTPPKRRSTNLLRKHGATAHGSRCVFWWINRML